MRPAGLDLTIDPHSFSFDTGCVFRGLTVTENGDGWNCVIRVRDKRGQPLYAMTVAEEPADGLNRLYAGMSQGNGDSLLRLDRYAKP